MLKEQSFDAGGVSINYVEGPPSGVPMVLVHGGGDRWQSFLPILPGLVTRWHVYALDLRGHGKSARVPGRYRPQHYVADVTAFLASRCVEPAILIGHSLGGWVALLAAAEQPEGVAALILGDPPLNLERFVQTESSDERVAMWRMLRGFATSGMCVPELASTLAALPVPAEDGEEPARYDSLPDVDAAYCRFWAKSLSQVDPDVAQYHAEGRIGEYVAKIDLESALRRLACPTLVLQGDNSEGGVLTDEDVEWVMALLGEGVHVRLDGAGHALGLDTWESRPLLRAVSGFCESL